MLIRGLQNPDLSPDVTQSRPAEAASDLIELTIVMPCLNEAETLERCIAKAQRFLDDSQIIGEIIVGDNGSTDGSQEIARRAGARVISVATRGYGAALSGAILCARGQYVIMGDADDSYDFADLTLFIDRLRAGDDLVMGNRFLGGIREGAMPWKNRYLGNPLLSGIGKLFFHCPAKDFHCGLRGFTAEAFAALDLRTLGMEFASEMVIKATLAGMKISEVPTTLDPDGRSRPPHLRPWRDGWRHLRFMLLYSPKWLFLIPGLITMLIGTVCGTVLLFGPLNVGFGILDVHSLLYAAVAVVIGFQAVAFAVFSKVFATNQGLLPEDPRFTRLFKYLTLEVGLLIGIVILALGLSLSVGAVLYWRSRGFGSLNASHMLRIVIPASMSLMIGFQTILYSFFLSVLGLQIRKSPPSYTFSQPTTGPVSVPMSSIELPSKIRTRSA